MGEQINKPLSLIRDDFLKALIDLINGSKLPPFIMEPILKDMYNDVHIAAATQLENERKAYEELIKKNSKK